MISKQLETDETRGLEKNFADVMYEVTKVKGGS